jgi:hypothetical protein
LNSKQEAKEKKKKKKKKGKCYHGKKDTEGRDGEKQQSLQQDYLFHYPVVSMGIGGSGIRRLSQWPRRRVGTEP